MTFLPVLDAARSFRLALVRTRQTRRNPSSQLARKWQQIKSRLMNCQIVAQISAEMPARNGRRIDLVIASSSKSENTFSLRNQLRSEGVQRQRTQQVPPHPALQPVHGSGRRFDPLQTRLRRPCDATPRINRCSSPGMVSQHATVEGLPAGSSMPGSARSSFPALRRRRDSSRSSGRASRNRCSRTPQQDKGVLPARQIAFQRETKCPPCCPFGESRNQRPLRRLPIAPSGSQQCLDFAHRQRA